jgi:hypothetical protein
MAGPQTSSSKHATAKASEDDSRKKKVSFNNQVKVLTIKNLKGKNLWYTDAEIKEIRAALLYTLELLDAGEIPDERRLSSRGLEDKYGKKLIEHFRRMDEVREAVLHEQEFQQENDTADEELLADTSSGLTHQSRHTALLRGLDDETLVKTLWSEQSEDSWTAPTGHEEELSPKQALRKKLVRIGGSPKHRKRKILRRALDLFTTPQAA